MTELPRSTRPGSSIIVSLAAFVPLAIGLSSISALAQSIVPAADGTGTQVTPQGDRFDIGGGQLSGDGTNLFHSFDRFGLESGQVANFLSNPNIVNIFGRVVGGDASYINGLLQVWGGNSNLYLLNPAGIVFGANASLNVPADFTATTATGIGFENQHGLNAVGENPWANLMGNPNALKFDLAHPGAIVNAGNLAVLPGSHLGLFGGVVVNTGTLQAPDGAITVTAVSGESVVRLSAVGNVLSLEVAPPSTQMGLHPLALPELLTGGHISQNSRLVVHADGTVSIIGSGLAIDPQTGTAIATGRVSVSGDAESIGQTPTVQVLGDLVVLQNTTIDASGINGGGNIFIGGDFQGNGTIPNARYTVIDAQSSIVADALQQGNGGRAIVWADETTGFFGNLSARGGLNAGDGGFVEVSGKQNLIFEGTVNLSAARGNLGTLLLDPVNITISNDPSAPDTVEGLLPNILAGDFQTEDLTINAETLGSQTGNVLLEATNDITIAPGTSLTFVPGEGSIALTANSDGVDGGSFAMGTLDTIHAQGRNLSISGVNITTGTLDTSSDGGDGGSISLSAVGDITTGSLLSDSESGVGGDITVTSSNGAIDTTGGLLDARSVYGAGGSISLSAHSDITTGSLWSYSGWGGSGDISLTSNNGAIDTTGGLLDAGSYDGSGGMISLSAHSDITTGSLWSYGGLGVGGDITLTSSNGAIDTTDGQLDATSDDSSGGTIYLSAHSDITTGDLNSISTSDRSGDIYLLSTQGTVDTTGGRVDVGNGNLVVSSGGGSVNIGNITLEDGGIEDVLNPSNPDVTSDADSVNSLSKTVTLAAQNDITLNEPIVSSSISSLELSAGRSINLNADIDTSRSNGNIILRANNSLVAGGLREPGIGNLQQAPGTVLNAGSGDILLELGNGELRGNITLADVRTTGTVSVNANGSNIQPAAADSLITAGLARFATTRSGGGGLGSSTTPLRVDVDRLEATSGSGGMFFDAQRSIELGQLSTSGNIEITAKGNIDITQNFDVPFDSEISLSATEDITLGDRTEGCAASSNSCWELSIPADDGFSGGGAVNFIADSDGDGKGDFSLADASDVISARFRPVTISGENITLGDVYTDSGTQYQGSQIEPIADGGDITLTAQQNITTGQINSAGILQGGNITITSENGSIDTSGIVQSRSLNGNAGAVTFEAGGSIFTQDILSDGAQRGNNISLSAHGGSIETGGALNSVSSSGQAGSITLSALDGITTADISSYSQSGIGGAVDISSTQGNLVLGDIATYTESNGDGGSITLRSNLNATSSVVVDNLRTESRSGEGGDIHISAFSSVALAELTTFSSLDSGNIAIEIIDAQNGDIQTGNITTEMTAGVSGDITINGFNLATGNVSSIESTSSGDITIDAGGTLTTLNISTTTETGDAADLDLDAKEDINTGDVTSSGGDNSGTISVISGDGSVTTGSLASEAGGGAGTIEVSAAGAINTGDITSAGGEGSGDISLDTATGEIQTGEVTTETGQVSINGEIQTGEVTPSTGEAQNQGTVAGRPGIVSYGYVVNEQIAATDDIPSISPESPTRMSAVARDSSLNPQVSLAGSSQRGNGGDMGAMGGDRTDATSSYHSDAPVLNLVDLSASSAETVDPSELLEMERQRNGEYASYLGTDLSDRSVSVESTRTALTTIAEETGYQSAVVYMTLLDDRIELVLFRAGNQPLRYVVPDVRREQVLGAANELRLALTSPHRRQTDQYLKSAQQLYQWLIAPLQPELQAAGIDTLLFSMDEGLRSLPIAALYDGEHFLVEQYSMSLIPSMGLLDTRYQSLHNTKVLAMGASQFAELNPLPAVPVELSTITQQLRSGKALLDSEFTQANLMAQRQEYPYPIVHLATHGEFNPGDASESFIQLWDEKLTLDRLRELGLNKPTVELLVLSACRTAVGDSRAELGFAGLAVAAGAKSALASLWYISDEGTLALMTEFYRSLTDVSIKADALRQAQIAMIRGQVRVESGRLIGAGMEEGIVLPPELSQLENTDFSHPYYWSAFTLIGSPW